MHSPFALLRRLRAPIALLLCFLLALPASAVPYLLNYQGRVAVDGQNFTGTGYFKFALIDGGKNQNRTAAATATVNMDTRVSAITVVDGGSGYRDQSPPAVTISGTGTGATATATVTGGVVTAITVQSGGSDYAAVPPPVVTIVPPEEDIQISTLWSNDGSSANAEEPDGFVRLAVNRGLYAVLLGSEDVAGMQPLPPALFAAQPDVRVRVWFSSNGGNFTLLTPDQRIAAVGYALMAEDVRDGSITAAKLAPGSVTAQAIAPGAVTLQQLSPEVQSALLAILGSQASQPPVITSSSIPPTSVDAGFSWQITATGAPNGYTATGLPAGLTLNPATGIISGSPTVPGTFTLSLTATNISGTSPVKQLSLTVSDAVYVDFAAGLDTNPGSAAQPVKTLVQGIGLAAVLTPDDYGPFARDGLDDAWQWLYFSGDPANAQPGDDPDSDGQDNALEFLAGTTPLDGNSFLQVRTEPVTGQPAERQLFFEPYRPDRTYRWEFSTALQPPWQPVVGDPPDPQPDGEARATDEAADEARKFYRLIIE